MAAAAHETGAGNGQNTHQLLASYAAPRVTDLSPPAHTLARMQGCMVDRVETVCIKRGPAPDECIGVVVCGAGAARAGIIVRGKPDKLDLSRGLICLDTTKYTNTYWG